MKVGDKLICHRSYGHWDNIFFEGRIYTIGSIHDDGRIGIILNEGSITEFMLSILEDSKHYYKKYLTTLPEWRDKKINEILDI